jgi:hypothetical protein
LKNKLAKLEQSIDEYLTELDKNDDDEGETILHFSQKNQEPISERIHTLAQLNKISKNSRTL